MNIKSLRIPITKLSFAENNRWEVHILHNAFGLTYTRKLDDEIED